MTDNKKHISDFMLSEYEHISEAHFESGKSISSFFRYYLLIMSTPAFVILLFDKNLSQIEKLIKGESTPFNPFICFFFCVIALVGYCLCVYIIDKKIQVTLYARTVNGIRKYFNDNSDEDLTAYLVLPIEINKPSYFKINTLFSMILPISVINSAFLFFALWIVGWVCMSVWLSTIFLLLHIITYFLITFNSSNGVR